jgi:hypothetical protein
MRIIGGGAGQHDVMPASVARGSPEASFKKTHGMAVEWAHSFKKPHGSNKKTKVLKSLQN